MTRKHFQALADAMKALKPAETSGNHLPETDGALMVQWRRSCFAVADVCQTQNVRFDRCRFLTACGLED